MVDFCRLMLVLLIVVKSRGQETILENAANEFIIGFSVNLEVSVTPSLLLFVTTPETNPVTFTVTANGFNFTGTAFNNSSTEVSIPSTFEVASDSERNKGIYVKAEGESKIVVYGLSYKSGTSDAFLALPCSNLAVEEYEYYAMTYPDRRPPLTSDVLIVGCEDNTLVTTPSNTITLNRLETYLIQSSDSTGMRVTSTKPVSFFSNQKCTDIPINNIFCDHLTEQLPPTSTWGTSFYAASLLGRSSGELFRIIAAKNSTTVTVNCSTFSQVQVYNLSVAGNWQEFRIHPLSFCTIESTAPLLVTQFALGGGLDNVGDPFMMMIPPVEQYSNNYVLNALSNFSTNYITIYVATKYYQPNRIFVDDTSQVSSSWTSVYCSNSLLCGYITRVNLTAGDYRLYHQDPHARIGLSAYGFSGVTSYGYPGGLKLQSTALPQLNVTVTGSEGTLTAGQNHFLTCIVSGGGFMAYTYMWLKDGSVVSGQTSSTYSFSPLLAVHSGQYRCKVSVGSMTMTSEGVDIIVERTATQLYFTWRGNRYEPGDSILITDIRLHDGDAGPGDSLVCVTTDVNTGCCTDVGGVGEWFLPNGNMVPRNVDDPNRNSQIIRTGRTNQVRLNSRTRQTSLTGEYTCVVPETGGLVNQTAGIILVTELPQLNVMLSRSGGTPTEGQNYMLTCTASGGGSLAYTYMWLKDGSVVSGQTSSTYSFSPLRVTDSGGYSCQVRVGSTTMNTSREVTITVMRCPIGSYLAQTSPGNTVCQLCPNNSVSVLPNSEVCECLQGYHRNPLEDIHVSCTRPPSACRNLRVYRKRTRANTITVRWERPLITGRDDYYYDIFYSDPELPGNFKKHNLNPFIKNYPLVTYSVSGLRPLTNYTIRVVSHNGVSDQDPEGEKERRCEVSETTGDIRAQPPRSVTSFCSVIVWKAPTRAYGVIARYEVSFSLPGGDNGVIVSKNRDELFHAVKASNLPRGEGDILIKVRAMTVSHSGTWSDAISLDCPGTDNGSACLGF